MQDNVISIYFIIYLFTETDSPTYKLHEGRDCLSYLLLRTQHPETAWHIIGIKYTFKKMNWQDFPGGAVVKNPPANAGDMGSSPGPGRSHMPRSN